MEWYYIILIVAGAISVLLFAMALLCDNIAFGKRADKNPYIKYFTADEFGLSAEEVNIPHGLKGFFYRSEKSLNKLIIFCQYFYSREL